MDFGSCREVFCEEQIMSKGKLPLSYSSSSSPSSSSSQHKSSHLLPLSNSPWEHHQHPICESHNQKGPIWLACSKYDSIPEPEDNNAAAAAAAAANNEDESRRRDSDSGLELRSASANIEKEHMFDKVVTPSDVGKLNRLVIPKQHAEKYFPLDSSTNEKGLLLNFEDRNGKPWRFRYSYWNSSQSYVMTKGWSRFVKEKKLDAGDIVSFQRGVGELGKDRLYIDWRRRPDYAPPDPAPPPPFHPFIHHQHHFSLHRSVPWNPLLVRPQIDNSSTLNRNSYYGGYATAAGTVVNHPGGGAMGSVFYLGSAAPQIGMEWRRQSGGFGEPIVFDSVPVVQGKVTGKRLRLFGVNMECPMSESDELSSTTIANASVASTTAAVQLLQPTHHQVLASSSSSQHPLQLRLYNGAPSTDFVNVSKGKASSMSFDLDM